MRPVVKLWVVIVIIAPVAAVLYLRDWWHGDIKP